MALRDTVYRLWGRKPGLPRLETVSDWADYLAFTAFAVLLLSIGGVGVALGVLGPSWALAVKAATIIVGEALVAGAFLGLSVLLDRASSYVNYLRYREEYREAMEDQPDPPQEHDVTPATNPTQTDATVESRTLPDRE